MLSIFLSHAWANDTLDRDTHDRVGRLAMFLKNLGIQVWFDEEQIVAGNIDYAMAEGIRRSTLVVFCLTEAYCSKVQNAAHYFDRDNCFKEWTLAHSLNKPFVPILMEPCMADETRWGCVVRMYLSGQRYIECDNISDTADEIFRILYFLMAARVPKRQRGQQRRIVHIIRV
jgi:hypothetical protein